jgi:hydroxymethylbilane synthase
MPDPHVIRVGTRASRLALWQTDHVVALLRQRRPDLTFEAVPIRTLGDRVLDVPLPRLGDRGLFTRELEDALRDGRIDLAVHSLKDLPTEQPIGLAVGAVSSREDPREVLISRARQPLAGLPAGARVGTSSLRRRAQVLALRPDLVITDIRGNVPTRVEKVERGEYDATLLAHAGLSRLGLTSAIAEVFDTSTLVPAAGQGALAVQVRGGDERIGAIVREIDDAATRLATTAERTLLAALQGGCQAPVGASAAWESDGVLRLTAVVASLDGRAVLRAGERAFVNADDAAVRLGRAAAARLHEQGAAVIVDEARRQAVAQPVPGEAP